MINVYLEWNAGTINTFTIVYLGYMWLLSIVGTSSIHPIVNIKGFLLLTKKMNYWSVGHQGLLITCVWKFCENRVSARKNASEERRDSVFQDVWPFHQVLIQFSLPNIRSSPAFEVDGLNLSDPSAEPYHT